VRSHAAAVQLCLCSFSTAGWLYCSRWSDDEDALITDRWEIFKLYASPRGGRLWWDLLGLVPADYIALAFHDPFSHDFPESECVTAYLPPVFRCLCPCGYTVEFWCSPQCEHHVPLADVDSHCSFRQVPELFP
jgi:hypothetical protein